MEWRHRDTNNFHLPIGEMVTTINDVSTLLHIPIIGQFYTYVTLDVMITTTMLVKLLGMDMGDASIKIRQCCGAHVRTELAP